MLTKQSRRCFLCLCFDLWSVDRAKLFDRVESLRREEKKKNQVLSGILLHSKQSVNNEEK